MNKSINDIIDRYKAREITLEEANWQLKAENAGLTLPGAEHHRRLDPGGAGAGLHSR